MDKTCSGKTSMSDDVNAQKLVNEAIERNLERNRQHAKSTRLRKKEMLEVMKSRIIELQKEAVDLEELLQNSSISSILLTLADTQPHSVLEHTTLSVEVPKGDILELLRLKIRATVAQKNHPCTVDEVFTTSSRSHRWLAKRFRHRHGSDSNRSDFLSGTAIFDADDVNMNSPHDSIDHSQCGVNIGGNLMDLIHLKEANDDMLAKKERNRLSTRFTRERKKMLQVEMQQLIPYMERQNRIMRDKLGCNFMSGPIAPLRL